MSVTVQEKPAAGQTVPVPPAIDITGLRVAYGSVQAVRDVTLQIRQGEIFGLLGPNGAGKTTTLSAIEGLIKPRSGSVIIAGYDTREKPLHARAVIGVQLQATSFQPELTVSEVMQLYAGVYGLDLNKEKLK